MNLFELIQSEGVKLKKTKGEHIFMQGDKDKSFYFISSGLLKAYYISSDGKEFVKSFLMPKDIIGSLTSTYSKDTCSFSLICLENTVITKIAFKKLLEYSQQNLKFANNIIELLLSFSMKKEKREYEFLCLSAQERYTLIEKTQPDLLTKVTQNDLARYLGITPVALSRIKNRKP